jgi:hypothetical protein
MIKLGTVVVCFYGIMYRKTIIYTLVMLLAFVNIINGNYVKCMLIYLRINVQKTIYQ